MNVLRGMADSYMKIWESDTSISRVRQISNGVIPTSFHYFDCYFYHGVIKECRLSALRGDAPNVQLD